MYAAVLDTGRYSSADGLSIRYDERDMVGLAEISPW